MALAQALGHLPAMDEFEIKFQNVIANEDAGLPDLLYHATVSYNNTLRAIVRLECDFCGGPGHDK